MLALHDPGLRRAPTFLMSGSENQLRLALLDCVRALEFVLEMRRDGEPGSHWPEYVYCEAIPEALALAEEALRGSS